MKILITGGMGYIGSHIIQKLQTENHEITILDNLTTSLKNSENQHELICADITNYESLKTNLQNRTFDVVLHLAAQSSGPASFKNPELDLKINILGTLNIIRLCDHLKIPRILFASSFTVYGDNSSHEMLTETLPCDPKSLYGVGKLTGEQYLKVYAEKLGIRWNALRMFNVYGPGQDLSRKDQGMVSIFLSYVREGNHIPLQGSSERFRDLVYIDDVVSAWMLCLKKDIPNQIFNVGSGSKTTIKELIDALAVLHNKNITIEIVEASPGDIMGCYADISKAKKQLDYNPQYDLKLGLTNFKNWADQTFGVTQ
ncbi:MAG: NAD-dependent epimerase/dehydratase family protein [Proteobacteria bacterium]|nr:NAD-dependent epimerase/dehydratase family protein [Pseudomonadota bacterium]